MVGYNIRISCVSLQNFLNIDVVVQFHTSLNRKIYPQNEGHQTEVWTVRKQQLTSAGNSTISNWYAISGKMPNAKAKMAPAEPTIL